MKRSVFFNVFLLCIIFFFLGGNFWLWKDTIFVSVPKIEHLPPEVSINEFTKIENVNPEHSLNTFNSSSIIQIADQSASSSFIEHTTTTIAQKEIPKQINLSVPFTSQAPEKNWDQPWQDACEEAAVLMLDAYYKKYGLNTFFSKDEIIKMVDWQKTLGWGLSIEIEKVQKLFLDYFRYAKQASSSDTKFLSVRIVENPSIGDIKKFISQGNPVYAVVHGKELDNPHFQNGGPEYHALIIRGYTETTFITNDPGTQFGENFQYTYENLMDSLHDWNGGDVKNGRPVVLVIE